MGERKFPSKKVIPLPWDNGNFRWKFTSRCRGRTEISVEYLQVVVVGRRKFPSQKPFPIPGTTEISVIFKFEIPSTFWRDIQIQKSKNDIVTYSNLFSKHFGKHWHQQHHPLTIRAGSAITCRPFRRLAVTLHKLQ